MAPPDAEVSSVDAFDFLGTKSETGARRAFSETRKIVEKGVHWHPSSYPSWVQHDPPVPLEDIAAIANNISRVLGLQSDSMINVFELLMSQLDSRASRSTPEIALRSLHSDYIGGYKSNFRKWYLASKMDLLDMSQFKPNELSMKTLEAELTLKECSQIWTDRMIELSDTERMEDLAIYLGCWSEANQVRFMPECLAFIFKCARDYYKANREIEHDVGAYYYLDNIITPLYNCYVSLSYTKEKRDPNPRRVDHEYTVGYDDINQLFWYFDGLKRLKLREDKANLIDLPSRDWYCSLAAVEWTTVFKKTFLEKRTWFHGVTNFSRIIILHVCVFWFYTAFNTPILYTPRGCETQPHIQWSIVAFGGTFAPLITAAGVVGEAIFVPRTFPGARPVLMRLLVLSLMLMIIVAPTIYISIMTPWCETDFIATVVAGVQFSVAIVYTVYFSTQPLFSVLGCTYQENPRKFLANEFFIQDFRKLSKRNQYISWLLCILVIFSKLTESYFFLTLSVRDPIETLALKNLKPFCVKDKLLGEFICEIYNWVILAAVLILEGIMFFLDTYLWYVIVNTLISVIISFYQGASIWTPWRNIYQRLPQRINSKLLTGDNLKGMRLLWNSIIDAFLKGNLLTSDQATKLSYRLDEKCGIVEPIFFTTEEDGTNEFDINTEAQRRISFFAQSLAQSLPDPGKIEQMPSFSVLITHYNEKIALSLQETISQGTTASKVTILEFLQNLYPSEWNCFVTQNKELKSTGKDLPLATFGFSSSDPRDTNRTRLWCSRRTQTLYRTVAGFSNYSDAIKLLYLSEKLGSKESDESIPPDLDTAELSELVSHKFRLILASQRLAEFDKTQLEEIELMLRVFPCLNIVFIERDPDGNYYSSLIDVTCPVNSDLRRQPKLRIKLSGNPILGDGKSDNQNHALPFYRGEYIQLVDANQDHYLEECLKIRNVLAEFEEMNLVDTYYSDNSSSVAIVGAREYIFSENIGMLGDVAAGKEQTFGTLFARTLATVGGKLHYGHPDLLNGVFMCTRGGVSKAQKGLHLNEDIYAGMTALCRGGGIKHTEYIQCGKGRDLGFISILNFTTKIGAGMGEQMLSREYFWLGTTLPFDRFISFYYAHPGFHLNNVCIITSLELMLTVLVWIASIGDSTGVLADWIRRFVISIAVVFFIALIPLFVQELAEKGLWKSSTRIAKHFASLSMLFEIFICRIYAQAFLEDLQLGGAHYIGTGRGFATTRVPFYVLFEGYAYGSLYFGARSFMLLLFVTIAFWQPALLWFWLTVVALLFSPVLFNPHQFNITEFFLDYRTSIEWFANIDSKKSWLSFVRAQRAKYTGDFDDASGPRPSVVGLFLSKCFSELLWWVAICLPYFYCSSQLERAGAISTLQRTCVYTLCIFTVNVLNVAMTAVICLVCRAFKKSRVVGKALILWCHVFSLLCRLAIYSLIFIMENKSASTTILAMVAVVSTENIILTILTMTLGRQLPAASSSDLWWLGGWKEANYGWKALMIGGEEFVCKVIECTQFSRDFLLVHFIYAAQLLLVIIPYIDTAHCLFLLWFLPSEPIPIRINQAKMQKKAAQKYAGLCVLTIAILVTAFCFTAYLPSSQASALRRALEKIPVF